MQYTASLTNDFLRFRQKAFTWRSESSIARKALMAAGMACATGLLAQVRIPLPWTPIPLTGQTFAVLMAGVLLGRNWGGLSMAFYMLLGMAGVPWFAGATGGLAVLMGPTGGYIAGFVLAALFVGAVIDNFPASRRFWPMVGVMLVADYILVHGPGLFQFGLWTAWVQGQFAGFRQLVIDGTVTFLAVDAIKVFAAAAVATGLLPKSNRK
jgi:biotin transport system substrate-specific component